MAEGRSEIQRADLLLAAIPAPLLVGGTLAVLGRPPLGLSLGLSSIPAAVGVGYALFGREIGNSG